MVKVLCSEHIGLNALINLPASQPINQTKLASPDQVIAVAYTIYDIFCSMSFISHFVDRDSESVYP